MKKRRENINDGMSLTSITLLAAFLGGLAILIYGESLLGDIQSGGDPHAPVLANWQIHLGSVCMGFTAFVIILFLLEILNQESKIRAWHSSWPWLPIVGLTGLASIIHIPAYVLVSVSLIAVAWAYLKTRKAWNGGRNKMNTKVRS